MSRSPRIRTSSCSGRTITVPCPASPLPPRLAQRQRAERRASGGALELGLDQVDGAQEPGEALVGGPLVEILRRALLNDAPVAQHRDRIGQRERLLLVVGDQYGGDALSSQQAVDLLANLRAKRGVERGEGLVQQQRLRLQRKCSGQRDPLLLAA